MRKLNFHAEADREVIEAARYYELQVDSLGVEFLDELDHALHHIQVHPNAAPLVGREIRRKNLRRFPYSLFYAVEPDRLRIVALAHQKRRPGYWRSRL